ncbi:MAG: MurR/RpiR family transcriptional regulator [Victivallales bacterium]|nr:MurR/RpiR family transcriptional regulator [Victivallales bacterium]
MNITPKCILQIKRLYSGLTGKYKDIADYILANPENIIRCKVREIAKDCNCDDALIIRFCQKIGYSGFSDFKTSIAAEFMPVKLNIKEKEFQPEDSFAELKRNFLDNNVKTLHDTIGLLEKQTVKNAVKILSGANSIYLLASGISGVVAEDIQIKLMRLGFKTVFHQDVEFSRIFMGLCDQGDAALAISFSGETGNVCEMVKIAKKKKIPVVAVSNYPDSSLAKLADVNLFTASDEKIFRLGAMTSRIAQYFIIDFLIINMVMGNMERTEEYILKTHEMISKHS